MTTIFQLLATGPAIGGWHGKLYSKRVFLTRASAEAYIPEFIAKCCDPAPLNALASVEKTVILDLDLEDPQQVAGIKISLQALAGLAWTGRLDPAIYHAARRITDPIADRRDKMRAIVDDLHQRITVDKGPIDRECSGFFWPGSGPMDADDACIYVAAAAMSIGIKCRIVALRFGQSWTCRVQYENGDRWETIDPLRQHTDRVPDELVPGPDPEDPQR